MHPGFVAVSALVLALGIGINAALFSIVHVLLFRALPVEASDDLVSIYQVFPRQPDRPTVLDSLKYRFLETHSEAFTAVTGHWGGALTVRADGETEVINAEWVLSNYFDVLGVKPALGRALLPSEDDVTNPERAVVISHALWTRRFQSDPNTVGKQIQLSLSDQSEVPCTIVGITGPEFNGVSAPWKPTLLWITMAQGRSQPDRGFSAAAIGRRKPGITFEQARTIVAAQGRQFHASRPGGRAEYEPRLVAYRTNDVRVPSDPSAAVIPTRLAAAMTIVAALVLLVAAANVAGILLARGVGRASELAVRRVLGAGPLRIARQLLAESLLLSIAGAVLGVILADWLLGLFRALTPAQFAVDATMGGPTLLFTTGICVIAGVVVGLLPARQATRLDVLPTLAGSGAAHTKPVRRQMRHAVTLPQVALSVMLLLVTSVYVRSLARIELTDIGYEPRNLLVANAFLRVLPAEGPSGQSGDARRQEQDAERSRRFYRELLTRLQALPGLDGAAIASSLPLREPGERPDWSVISREGYQSDDPHGSAAERSSVSPGYFRVMQIALVAGREFDERDTRDSPRVAIVSAAVAARLWHGGTAVGRVLAMRNEWAPGEKLEWHEVVGVVGEVRPVLHERAVRPFVYLPLAQEWRPSTAYVLARGSGDSRTFLPAVRDAVMRSDPHADVRRAQTMSQMIGEILYPRRVTAAILGTAGTIALLLATLGVYGVVSYSIAQRAGEIGVRIALGAERHDIVRLVLREGGAVAALGSAVGVALGYGAIRITSSTYLAAPPVDVLTLVAPPLLLGSVVLLACYLPARTAARLDAMAVLRRS
jgi:predicted permease